ncbi:hypothetical protein ACU4GH_03250 [Bradyrhizobium betae]|jgi:hypothetical protein|uniref:hypothetical protein n=1 Tax=Bradyrhizobium betae TaxID=244734 RepID=UPI003D677D0B
MIETIARLRKIADETESQARLPGLDRTTRSDMIDLAARWQWLAGEAAKLCATSNALNGRAACASCQEHCISNERAAIAHAAVA